MSLHLLPFPWFGLLVLISKLTFARSPGEFVLGSVLVAVLCCTDWRLVQTQQQSEAESVKSYLKARGLRAQPKDRGLRGRILLAQLSSAAGFIIIGFQAAQRNIPS